MSWPTAPRAPRRLAIALILAAALGALFGGCGSSQDQGQVTATPAAQMTPQITRTTRLSPAGAATVDVGRPLGVHPVTPGFLGLSIEYYAVPDYTGHDPAAVDPLFVQLVRNLDPGQRPVLRIGGDSTDWAWLPTAGLRRSGGLKLHLTQRDVELIGALARDLDARLILGINLEARSTALARNLTDTLLGAVGDSHLEALELGNEPDLYDVLGWYAARDGDAVLGRAAGYSLTGYVHDFDRIAAALPQVPLAGPASGAASWNADLSDLIAHAPRRLKLVTVHAYPAQTCGTHPGLASYPTIASLLSRTDTLGVAERQEPAIRAARAAGDQIRVDELNSIACFGAKGISNTYAAALWALETAFQYARLGVDGLNLTTVPTATYRLWTQHRASAAVSPEYYGLLDFAAAVPAGSRILDTPESAGGVQTFAARTPEGQTHVVVVNPDPHATRVALRVSGAEEAPGTVTVLSAPSLTATAHVSLAGQSFGPASADGDVTATGQLAGRASGIRVIPVHGRYVVDVPADSAVTLSVD